MSKFVVHFSYKSHGSSSSLGTSITVQAETEATAIRVVEDRYPNHEVLIKSVKRA